jgi:hypothetical protein
MYLITIVCQEVFSGNCLNSFYMLTLGLTEHYII